MSIKEETIEKIAYVGSPNDYIVYRELFKLSDGTKSHVLKIVFNTDFNNSFGLVVYVLTNNGWENLYSIPMKLTKTKVSRFDYEKNPQASVSEFEEDVKNSKKVVKKLLF